MARKDSVRKDKASVPDGAMSLFDRDNLEFLGSIRISQRNLGDFSTGWLHRFLVLKFK
jgi:hypothetical protein